VSPRKRLVGVRKVEVADAALLAELEAAPRMMEGRLDSPEHRVDAGALPLPPAEVDDRPDLAPVVTRSMRPVQHRVVVGARALRQLEQPPR
jgi:hypothetical protein